LFAVHSRLLTPGDEVARRHKHPVPVFRGLPATRARRRLAIDQNRHTHVIPQNPAGSAPIALPLSGLRRAIALPGMKASMAHDLERGNRLEFDGLSGKVVVLGRELGVPTQPNEAAYRALKRRGSRRLVKAGAAVPRRNGTRPGIARAPKPSPAS
jgi:Ketopantoate reductase PanE/ApbA C terminal